MRKMFVFILFSLTLFAMSEEKKEKILNDFNAFKKNYSERKAEETVKYFSKDSIKLYDGFLLSAVNGGENDGKLGFLESMVILSIQTKLSAEEMKKMSGKDVIVWSINEGMDSFEKFNVLPVIDVYEKDGSAYIVLGYDKDKMDFRMVYEEGLWKVDMVHLFGYINGMFENIFAGKVNEETFIQGTGEEKDWYYKGDGQALRGVRGSHEAGAVF